MRRRRFIGLAGGGIAALIISSPGCNSKERLLSEPSFILGLVGIQGVQKIGAAYRNMNPGEGSEDMLQGLILDEISDQSSSSLGNSILKKIQIDFLNDRVVVVEGWVLSVTEARQAALYSLKF